MDLVIGGAVYFNHLNDDGIPTFTKEESKYTKFPLGFGVTLFDYKAILIYNYKRVRVLILVLHWNQYKSNLMRLSVTAHK